MQYVAAFDVGTTAIKGVLVSVAGEVLFSESKTIQTIYEGDHKEQDPNEWYQNFQQISKTITNLPNVKENIIGIIMSGQMQDLILVDIKGNAVSNAILYSDGRAQEEATAILDILGRQEVRAKTGNTFDGTMPLAKLLWVKNSHPPLWEKTRKLLISSKDYCVLKLTGKPSTDYTSAATSGMMDITNKTFRKDWLAKLGLDSTILPKLKAPADIVGQVTAQAAEETGYVLGTAVYAGIGDAGATTLASGISEKGEVNIHLGTSGWVATISESLMENQGVFNLVAAKKNLYINVVPFLNAGNIHKWISSTLADASPSNKYAYIADLLKKRIPGSKGLLFLPYLVGERFPTTDVSVKGCYYGITPETKRVDLVSAALEGVAFSIRQGLDKIIEQRKKITFVGGGAKERNWCQIFADVLGQKIYVFPDAEYSSALALAGLVSKSERSAYSEPLVYNPRPENIEIYNHHYRKFKELYPRLKGF